MINRALNTQTQEKMNQILKEKEKNIEEIKSSTGFKFSCNPSHQLGPHSCINCTRRYQKNYISKNPIRNDS